MFNFFQLLDKKQKIFFFNLLFLITLASIAELLSISILIPFFAFFLGENINIEILSTFEDYIISYGISDPAFFLLILIIVGFVVKNLLLGLTSWQILSFTNNLKINIGSNLVKNFLYEDYEKHLQKKSSEILNNNITQLNILTKTIILINRLFNEIIVLTGLIIVLVFINYKIFLFVIGILILFSGLIYFFLRSSNFKWGVRRFKMERNIFSTLINSFNAFKEIKIFQKQKFFISYYIQQEKKLGKSLKLGEFFRQINKNILEILAILIFFFLSFYLLKFGFEKKEVLFYLGSYIIVIGRLFPSTNKILSSLQSLQFNKLTIDTIIENYNRKHFHNESDIQEKNFSELLKENLTVNNVSFGFKKDDNILNELSLEIKHKSLVGIFGKTGSGKSTLLDLIMGLHEPNDGKVLVDGRDIKSLKKEWLRNIAYVGQNNFIFDESIVSNITYIFKDAKENINNKTVDKDLLRKAVEYSCLDDLKEKIFSDEGSRRDIGEKGNQLSGGQLQRIAIARAIYSKRPILIFDEVSSALDEKTEIKIFEKLLKLKQENKTIIISSHSKNLTRFCDLTFNLDEKNI